MIIWRILLTIAVTLSAALVFSVQPMMSKLLLPMLGGVPAVWNTSLVLYQVMLLAGYVYVHLTSRHLSVPQQVSLHTVVLWLGGWAASFRVYPAAGMYAHPALWVAGQLLRAIGLPFLALSATAPLLQRWLARAPHPDARNPYILYAASNVGTILGLTGYVLLAEPLLPMGRQVSGWTWGYTALAAVVTICGAWVWASDARPERVSGLKSAAAAPTEGASASLLFQPGHLMAECLQWMLYAFVPCGLLVGVSNHITTDITPMPLLWIIPLLLYFLTFVLVFARRPLARHSAMLRAQTYLALPPLLLYLGKLHIEVWIDFPVHLAAFFVSAMVCHGELARRRPSPRHLTEFYVWMAAGGMLGGLAAAILAPLVFQSIVEYPLLLIAACVIRPSRDKDAARPNVVRLLLIGLLAFALLPAGLMTGSRAAAIYLGAISLILVSGVGGAAAFVWLRTPWRVALALGGVWLSGSLIMNSQEDVLARTRSFFGTVRVVNDADNGYHLFYHGTTLQGAQATDPQERLIPRTYHHREGPLGQILTEMSTPTPRTIAVLGLGVGTVAAYGRQYEDQRRDRIVFYEIDAEVERVARDPALFTYLADSAADIDVVLGDARLSLQHEPDAAFDIIIQDAFSSDSIPVHLLTREAFRIYLDKLAPGGLLACNITNRYLDLEPVLAALLADAGLTGLLRDDGDLTPEAERDRRFPSIWVAAARDEAALEPLRRDPRWRRLRPRAGMRVWTDDYANILGVLRSPLSRKAGAYEKNH